MSSIRVVLNGKICLLPVETGENLLSALRRAGYSLPASCGGRGRCGKCRVPVNGVPRLACKVIAQDGDTVELPEQAGGVILTDASAQNLRLQPGRTGCGAAVDLGTTTVVLRLYDLEVGTLLSTVSAWNAQASYGADVISRIQYTLERADGAEELSRRIRAQVQQLLTDALHRAERDWSELREITLAGNTVMQHLFDGRTVAGIAAVPFEPETLFAESAGKPLRGVPVRFAPCVAGYVGGDLTAGLLASGPAFEGAGISCGMPGIDGAVSHVRWQSGFLWDVVGGGAPKGLCGSGLLDLAAVLLEREVITPGGRLLPPEEAPAEMRRWLERDAHGNGVFHLTPEVALTAEDVRALQLAKAAVAAGIQVLLERRGIAADKLDGIYLAGGFGNYLDPKSAVCIGMLPEACAGRLHSLGNSALAGASMLALDGRRWAEIGALTRSCQSITLSGNPDFNNAFAAHMPF